MSNNFRISVPNRVVVEYINIDNYANCPLPNHTYDWIIVGLGSTTPSLLSKLSGDILVIDAGPSTLPESQRTPFYNFSSQFSGADQYLIYANSDGKLSPLTCGIGAGGTSRVNVGFFTSWDGGDIQQIANETGLSLTRVQELAEEFKSHLTSNNFLRHNSFTGTWIDSLVSGIRTEFDISPSNGIYDEFYMISEDYYYQNSESLRYISTDIYPVSQSVISNHRLQNIHPGPDNTWFVDCYNTRNVILSMGINNVPFLEKQGWIPKEPHPSYNHYGIFTVFQIDDSQIPENFKAGDFDVLGSGMINVDPTWSSHRQVEIIIFPVNYPGINFLNIPFNANPPYNRSVNTKTYAIGAWLVDRKTSDNTYTSDTDQMRYNGNYLDKTGPNSEYDILTGVQTRLKNVLASIPNIYNYQELWSPVNYVYDTYHQSSSVSTYLTNGQIQPNVYVVDYSSNLQPFHSHPVAPLMIKGLAWGEKLNSL